MNLSLVSKYYESRGGEYEKKLRQRALNLKQMEDPLTRARLILDVYSVDPVRFIEDFLFLKIPNYNNAIKPFFLFDYQIKIIQKLQESEADLGEHLLLVDKPREMGLTWIICAYMLWRWLFTPNWSGFILSRTETEVDDGGTTPDSSIFGKIRWLQSKLPRYLLPESFTPKGKKGTQTDMTLKIFNPAIQSLLMGSSTNSNAGRSKRFSFTFVDECFYIENFNSVWRALESVSRVKCFASSAKQGKTFKDFQKMCEEKGDYINLKWQDHPWKDEEWFKELERKAEFDPEVMKEAVVSYAINPKAQYYPEIEKAQVTDVPYDPSRPVYMSMDFGAQDKTVLIWWQYDGSFKIIACYANSKKDIEWYAPFMNPELQYNPSRYTDYQIQVLERVRKFKKPSWWFGEAAHAQRVMPLNRSIKDELFKYGVRLTFNPMAVTHEPRRHTTARILPMTIFNESDDYVMELYDAILNSRYSNAVSPTSKQSTLKPVHDKEIADYRAAFENGAVNLMKILRTQREERTEQRRSLTASIYKYLK